MVEAEEDIRQSLMILLNTTLGERVMQPLYGASLKELLFEPMNTSLASYVADLVRTAILYHEPRITPDRVAVSADEAIEGKMLVEVDFTVRVTNTRLNYVYPFYLEEGTDI